MSSTTDNTNQVDTELEEILLNLSTSKTSFDKPKGRQILTDIFLDEATQALTAWRDKAVVEELERLKHANHFGFERLALVVECQDGSDSGVIPYRKHWNDCYDKFTLTVDDRIKQLQQSSQREEG